jgi:hypothetical protein
VLPIRQTDVVCAGRDPKTLAFCASRSHIVAVR